MLPELERRNRGSELKSLAQSYSETQTHVCLAPESINRLYHLGTADGDGRREGRPSPRACRAQNPGTRAAVSEDASSREVCLVSPALPLH